MVLHTEPRKIHSTNSPPTLDDSSQHLEPSPLLLEEKRIFFLEQKKKKKKKKEEIHSEEN